MDLLLQVIISVSILIAGIFALRILARFIAYLEYQDRFNPNSKNYRQYVHYDPDTHKYEIRIAKVNWFKTHKSPISRKALQKIG